MLEQLKQSRQLSLSVERIQIPEVFIYYYYSYFRFESNKIDFWTLKNDICNSCEIWLIF